MKFRRTLVGFVFGVLVAVAIGVYAEHGDSEDSFTSQQVGQIQNIVHTYLVAHPEVLVEASQALQQQELSRSEAVAKTAIGQLANTLFRSKHAPVAGNPTGSVTLVEFFDYQCPHCIYMTPIVDSLIKTNSNLRVVSMDFPIFGEVSEYAARAALAAGMQGKYWQMHDAIFMANKRLTKEIVNQLAEKVGLNMQKLKQDMHSQAVTDQLMTVRMLAQKLQLQGTPAFVVAPSDFKSGMNDAKVSFFPGQVSEATLQKFINSAE